MPQLPSRLSQPASRTWLGTDAQVVRHIIVGGSGQLATATRVELGRLGIHRATDYELPSLHPPLVIACGDSERDASFGEFASRAAANGSPLLLACLTGGIVRVGPLVEPPEGARPTARDPRRGPRSGAERPTPKSVDAPLAEPDASLSLHARLGALLVCAQALNFLLGARKQCVMNRVIELNPWSIESRAYKVLKVRQ